jgi:hypothetical protein
VGHLRPARVHSQRQRRYQSLLLMGVYGAWPPGILLGVSPAAYDSRYMLRFKQTDSGGQCRIHFILGLPKSRFVRAAQRVHRQGTCSPRVSPFHAITPASTRYKQTGRLPLHVFIASERGVG